MTSHRIVPIAEEHIEGFRAAVDSVARERRYLAMVQAPPLGDVRDFVLGNIAADVPHFVAIAGGEIVGWCDASPKPRETLKHSLVLGMGVVHPFRAQGIGAQLLEAVLNKAKQKGFARVELTVRVDNDRAKKLYEKCGFTVEGLCRRYMCIDGEYKDSYLMALLY
jgi:RimJ/RimL family protein N-acetyltransferase